MPLTTATQKQVATLTESTGRALPALRRARDGSTKFPLRTEDRLPLEQNLEHMVLDLRELGMVPDAPIPSDVVVIRSGVAFQMDPSLDPGMWYAFRIVANKITAIGNGNTADDATRALETSTAALL